MSPFKPVEEGVALVLVEVLVVVVTMRVFETDVVEVVEGLVEVEVVVAFVEVEVVFVEVEVDFVEVEVDLVEVLVDFVEVVAFEVLVVFAVVVGPGRPEILLLFSVDVRESKVRYDY